MNDQAKRALMAVAVYGGTGAAIWYAFRQPAVAPVIGAALGAVWSLGFARPECVIYEGPITKECATNRTIVHLTGAAIGAGAGWAIREANK